MKKKKKKINEKNNQVHRQNLSAVCDGGKEPQNVEYDKSFVSLLDFMYV